MNVMIAWELGSGMGHLGRHLDLAQTLALRGHQVTFAVKDLRLARSVLEGVSSCRYVQAPRVGRSKSLSRLMTSYVDILDHHGMADPDSCTALLHAWEQVFRICGTDIVLLDHAPGALFAAKCLRIKSVGLETGFTCPPSQTPFPAFRTQGKGSKAERLDREVACLAAMNPFAVRHGMAPFQSFAQALQADVPLLTTFPELDHYPQRTGGRYIGPTHGFTDGQPVNWSGLGTHKVFVYLSHALAAQAVLKGLGEMGAEVEVLAYCPELDAEQRKTFQSQTMRLLEQPAQMRGLLKNCDLVISHGGHGLMTACVLNAVNVLIIPVYQEQRLMAVCVKRSGIGVALSLSPRLESQVTNSVRETFGMPEFKLNAVKLQRKYQNFDLEQSIARLVNTIERLAAGKH